MADHPSEQGGDQESGPARPSPTMGDFFWLGTACAICVIGGGAIGYGLDAVIGTTPWVTFAGLVFGVVSAVLLMVSKVRRFL